MNLMGKISDIEDARNASARALGMDPTLLSWERIAAAEGGAPAAAPDLTVDLPTDFAPLTELEWQTLAPLLPPDRSQLNVMGNRNFLNAVLETMARCGRWVARDWSPRKSEGVRRRFSRWAKLGVFQRLAEMLPELALVPETKRLLALAAHRARRLDRNPR
jgi:transposase